MAAPLRRGTFSVQRYLRNKKILCGQSLSASHSASSSNEGYGSTESRAPRVGLTTDGSTIVCWHPEPTFPYEYTKPLPRQEVEMTEGDSVLKVQLIRDYELRHRPDGPTIKELSNIFHTSKHRWYPNKQVRFRKPNPPKDRDSI